MSCYFVEYPERLRGFKFYDPLIRSFFETGNAKFIEDVELSGREPLRKVVFEERNLLVFLLLQLDMVILCLMTLSRVYNQ